jgi:uncharacterized protein (DUF2236 family)
MGSPPTEVRREDLERSLAQLAAEVSHPLHGIAGPSSISWRISREALLFAGGGRAALLQLAHPFVAQAVGDHSKTREDVRGRFRRTFENVYAMTFGSLSDATRAARRVHSVHTRITGSLDEAVGPFPKGTPYRANDVDSLLWVYATLVDTSVMVYELAFGRLETRERDRYLVESVRFADLFGIPRERVPVEWHEFQRYFDDTVRSTLAIGSAAREMGRFLTTPPSRLHAPGMEVYVALTAGLLPEHVRRGYGLRFGLGERALFRLGARSLAAFRLLPARLRHVPAYIEAERRVRGEPAVDRVGRAVERAAARVLLA